MVTLLFLRKQHQDKPQADPEKFTLSQEKCRLKTQSSTSSKELLAFSLKMENILPMLIHRNHLCDRVFKNYIPQLLRGNQTKHHFLNTFIQKLESVLGSAKSLTFPLPLLSVAHQQLIAGSSHGRGGDDATMIKVWEKVLGVNITEAANLEPYNPELLAKKITAKSNSVSQIGFIGLGAMGFGMATHLLRSNFCVHGYDYIITSCDIATLSSEAINSVVLKDMYFSFACVEVLVVMVTNESQAESVLYGDFGALSDEHKNLKLVDAPVSGGVKRASEGTLTILASGSDEALRSSGLVLSALSEKLYVLKGGCGAGSGVKMINQLLAGVHIASSAEAMAFGARLGLNTRVLSDAITNSEGTSWMFENRVPHMVENDYKPLSALDIFVKDLGIVSSECASRRIPLHVATAAYQLFLSGSAAGWGRLDDAAVVKVYETLTGVKVEGKLPILEKESVLQSLPSEWPLDPIVDICRLDENNSKTLIVLDDDPTGTQTVHGIDVLTEWDVDSLAEQFIQKPKCFFILTNSRSLSSEKASALIADICQNLSTAAKSAANNDYTVEPDAVVSVLGDMDAWIICPFFLQGGRFTIGDIHYVAESDRLIPAGETEFAKDASFGYKSSNLREWVEEKTRGRIPASSVASVSIQLLRKGGPDAVCKHLCSLKKGSVCIVNAASERDMSVFASGMIQAELKGKHFLCRSAASFVSARIGIIPKAPVLPKDLELNTGRCGGLIIVGSYVPKTTKQISVDKVAMKSIEERDEEINRVAEVADIFLKAIGTVLCRNGGGGGGNSFRILAFGQIIRLSKKDDRVSKGGITSSDIATRALEAKRAKVVGQALPGVPLWQLGPESRHPGVPYIVFPGNVGDSKALAEVVQRWSRPVRLSSTKELLANAEKEGYAVGAFNVYNLEGVEAVVTAAEEEQSPAILQMSNVGDDIISQTLEYRVLEIHPSAFKQGGIPLVACCISAAEQASVPITVHFDHGNSKEELVEVLELGFDSVMVDGSHLPLKQNTTYTRYISSLAHMKGMLVEAELGRLSGSEDDLTIEDYEARLTDVNQTAEFIDETGIDALAVCIGNVHGKYPTTGPNLRIDLLKDLYELCSKKGVYVVLHGASGLPKELVKECIVHGVRKFNVNTEVRKAYMDSLCSPKKDLVHVMTSVKEAMKAVVVEKMRLFGSAGKAC
ncbi:hypothetical protein RJ640_002322 [Escallonia rubra]|uniref:Ketose-bisphosphate aldolase class-II family protein n=1 Tax=Escallonia rubra TaxID=112253 RepID=A0AA88RF53_9ASTE|nr:hypothetical protein RJ640_002322 [Escallonia rubra]